MDEGCITMSSTFMLSVEVVNKLHSELISYVWFIELGCHVLDIENPHYSSNTCKFTVSFPVCLSLRILYNISKWFK